MRQTCFSDLLTFLDSLLYLSHFLLDEIPSRPLLLVIYIPSVVMLPPLYLKSNWITFYHDSHDSHDFRWHSLLLLLTLCGQKRRISVTLFCIRRMTSTVREVKKLCTYKASRGETMKDPHELSWFWKSLILSLEKGLIFRNLQTCFFFINLYLLVIFTVSMQHLVPLNTYSNCIIQGY